MNRRMADLSALPGHLKQVADGTRQMQEGSTALVSGINRFSSGFYALKEGNARLTDGAQKLQAGLKPIADGQRELADKLRQAAQMAAQDGKSDERIDVIADPVIVKENNLHPVPNNGTGFAPYFIALSLWVGSLVLFFVIDLRTVAAMPKHPLSYLTNKYVALASVSIFQAILSVFVLHTGLGLPTVLPPLQLYAFSVITGLAFTAIMFFLLSVLGNDVGRFVAVLILMLQLAGSGGSYPVELEPGFFSFIHPYLPMTYAVDGFRQLISIGGHKALWSDAAVLAGFGIGSLALLFLIKRRTILLEINERTQV